MTRWFLVCMALTVGAPLLSVQLAAAEPAASGEDAASANENTPGKPDGLPLPRFVSLRADSVNLRVGPNARYPIEWIYVRKNLPVEVIAEFDTWRRIKDPDGTEGWVHSTMLSGRRTGMVAGAVAPLRRNMDDAAEPVANLEPGVIVQVQRCPAGTVYCRVEAQGIQGWIRRDQFWGVYPDEVVN